MLKITANTASYVSERPYIKPWYLLNLQEYIEVHAIVLYRKKGKLNNINMKWTKCPL